MAIRPFILLALASAAAAQSTAPHTEEQALFTDLPRIETVSLHAQTLAEAPANVTVITAAEIRRYGHRTLAEALASVRGFYVTYDHTYHYVGVSGVALPGDFNTRFLVMLNGHPLTDNIYNANNFFAQDFGVDMDLVERIEIIRGPTSALYGSNGILANINIVTRSPVDGGKLAVSAETGSYGEDKVFASSSVYLGHGANLLVSASLFRTAGMAFPIAGFAEPVSDSDGEHGYHTFANLIWHNWSFTVLWGSRDKQFPVGLGTSLSGDPEEHTVDERDVVGASHKRALGPGELEWHIDYDRYRYHDRFDYPEGDGSSSAVRDYNRGDWMDSSLSYALPVAGVGTFTAGVSGSWDIRAEQYNVAGGARLDYTNRPERDAAAFAQQEWKVAGGLKLYGGVRIDDSRYYGSFASPRVAAVWQASPRTVYKLVYGRPFRNPSAFEQFYNDGGLSYLPAPPLGREVAQTWQASVERQLARGWTLIANGFRYQIDDCIEAVTLADGVQQYRNTSGYRSAGAELELSGKLWRGLAASASASVQKAVGGTPSTVLPNSPRQLGKARLSLPVWRERILLAASAQLIAARESWTGSRLGGTALIDTTATVRVSRRFNAQAGARNLFDRRYEDPVYLAADRLRGDGRTAFLKLIWKVFE